LKSKFRSGCNPKSVGSKTHAALSHWSRTAETQCRRCHWTLGQLIRFPRPMIWGI
jgi:hypothetical protein